MRFRQASNDIEEALRPRGERPEFKALRVAVTDGKIAAMEVIDSLEQITRIEFTAVELGGALDQNLFRFEPPPGVDVIGQEDF
jgi:outer membrane lipoprotein carrier protein